MNSFKDYLIASLRPISTLVPAITVALFLIDNELLAVAAIAAYYFISTRIGVIGSVLNILLWIAGLVLCIVNLPRSAIWLTIYIIAFIFLIITGRKAKSE